MMTLEGNTSIKFKETSTLQAARNVILLCGPKETAMFKVEKDPSWELNVLQLEVFFKTHFLPVYLDGGL